MKKLIVAVAIVCAAAVSQAASTTWGGSVDIYDWNNDAPGVGTIQFFIDGAAQDAITMVDGSAAFDGYSITDSSTVKVIATVTNFADGTGTKEFTYTLTPEWVSKQPTFDDALGMVTASINSKFDAESAGIDFSLSAAANTYTAVPEPTSGLLLLLGVAGLALKRRRA